MAENRLTTEHDVIGETPEDFCVIAHIDQAARLPFK